MVEIQSWKDLKQVIDEKDGLFIVLGRVGKQLNQLDLIQLQIEIAKNELTPDTVSHLSLAKMSSLTTSSAYLIVAKLGAARLVELLTYYAIDTRMDGIYISKKHEAVMSL
ncbi:hypothetical protein [Alkalicoccobacillus porphyridii]|uniref:Uncharacterized protein n=1 Tax=Alkalicoccobacillus porphyridii TaxID=2597270 RepID=A0A554A4C9_9BACI|nr:hypothetical protein [Alkalicoccobacillus porphyridii]TSB48532.1 hypothetical protein FN960_02980 [Alkalicoccobacillus porphyridii]